MFDWFLLLPRFKAKGGINHSSTQKHILHGLLLLNYTWMWEELKGFLVCVPNTTLRLLAVCSHTR